MTIKEYISERLAGSVATTTLNKRVNWLTNLANEFPGATDFSFLNDYKKVKKYIERSEVITTRWSWLWHVIAAIKSDPSLINEDALKKYEAIKTEYAADLSIKTEDTKKNPKQKVRLESNLETIQAELRAKIADLYEAQKLDYRVPIKADLKEMDLGFAKKLQDLVILGAYIFQPALRNDWGNMIFTSSKSSMDRINNYLFIRANQALIIMNTYKNSKTLGHQEIVVRPELLQLLKIWKVVVTHFTGEKAKYVLYYEIVKTKNKFNHVKNDEALRLQIPRTGKRVLGVPRSINDYRHLHEIAIQADPEYPNLSMDQKKRIHNELLHGTHTALYYNVV